MKVKNYNYIALCFLAIACFSVGPAAASWIGGLLGNEVMVTKLSPHVVIVYFFVSFLEYCFTTQIFLRRIICVKIPLAINEMAQQVLSAAEYDKVKLNAKHNSVILPLIIAVAMTVANGALMLGYERFYQSTTDNPAVILDNIYAWLEKQSPVLSTAMVVSMLLLLIVPMCVLPCVILRRQSNRNLALLSYISSAYLPDGFPDMPVIDFFSTSVWFWIILLPIYIMKLPARLCREMVHCYNATVDAYSRYSTLPPERAPIAVETASPAPQTEPVKINDHKTVKRIRIREKK
jgi:hypothetical protein